MHNREVKACTQCCLQKNSLLQPRQLRWRHHKIVSPTPAEVEFTGQLDPLLEMLPPPSTLPVCFLQVLVIAINLLPGTLDVLVGLQWLGKAKLSNTICDLPVARRKRLSLLGLLCTLTRDVFSCFALCCSWHLSLGEKTFCDVPICSSLSSGSTSQVNTSYIGKNKPQWSLFQKEPVFSLHCLICGAKLSCAHHHQQDEA